MKEIDINCDMGEGIGNEEAIMPYISSCNVACGGHAGDVHTMRKTVELALQHGVAIGAHPSYPDRAHFGRRVMEIADSELKQSIKEQLMLFQEVLDEAGASLHHIKPHGALYNEIARNSDLAHCFLDAIVGYKHIPLYVPYASKIQEIAASRGFVTVLEAFADRNYNPDGTLVSRKEEKALIEAPEEVLDHLIFMVQNEQVQTLSKEIIEMKAATYCVHGDTPSALEILVYLHQELSKHNIQIKK